MREEKKKKKKKEEEGEGEGGEEAGVVSSCSLSLSRRFVWPSVCWMQARKGKKEKRGRKKERKKERKRGREEEVSRRKKLDLFREKNKRGRGRA